MFEHSVKVPRLYKIAAKLAKEVKEDNASLKRVVFENKHVNKKALYALILEALQHETQLDFLFRKSQILTNENRLDPWLARILVTELLWGKKKLSGESKPIQTVLGYYQIFQAHLDEVHEDAKKVFSKTVTKPRYVRVNTLASSVNEAVEGFRDEGWIFARFTDTKDYEGFLERAANLGPEEFMVDIHIKELLLFPPNTQFYQHSAYKSGYIFLQDKASCLPVKILNPEPGSTVLDMCAAPGMKTSQIAAMLNNEGTVYAVERDLKRSNILKNMIETSGASCVQIINKDVLTVTATECPNVDYILVDPSCSGTGITGRLEMDSNSVLTDERRLKNLAGFQIKILKHALRSFPDVKRVVYSTCSLNPQENEEVVKEVISSNRRFKLVPVVDLLNGPWFNFGSEDYGEIGKYCLYAKPEQDLSNGFFVAAFEKLEDGEENPFFNNQWNNFVNNKLNSNMKVNRNIEGDDNVYNEESIDKNDRWKRRRNKLAKESNLESDNLNDAVEETNKEKKREYEEDASSEPQVDTDVVSKKKRKKSKKADNEESEVQDDRECNEESDSFLKPKKKKKNKVKNDELVDPVIDTNGEGNVAVEKKEKKKKKKQEAATVELENNASEDIEIPKRKSKKHKKNA